MGLKLAPDVSYWLRGCTFRVNFVSPPCSNLVRYAYAHGRKGIRESWLTIATNFARMITDSCFTNAIHRVRTGKKA